MPWGVSWWDDDKWSGIVVRGAVEAGIKTGQIARRRTVSKGPGEASRCCPRSDSRNLSARLARAASKAVSVPDDGGVALAEPPVRPAGKADKASRQRPNRQPKPPAPKARGQSGRSCACRESGEAQGSRPVETLAPDPPKSGKSTPAKKAPAVAAEASAPGKLAAKPAAKTAAPAPQRVAEAPAPAAVARVAQPAAWSALGLPRRQGTVLQMIETFMDNPSVMKVNPKLANAWKTKAGHELTDEEVMAMPEDEYMNDKQLAFFKHKLEQLKEGLLSAAGETTEHLREDTSVVPDPADRATIEEEHALELRTRDRERKLLKKINQSIGRIDSGEYGYCDETGEPIGLGRLIARPTANLSLKPNNVANWKQKLFGD